MSRSDIDEILEEQRRRPEWPTERALIADFAIQIAMIFEKLREEQGLSYQELADKAGTSKPHVIRLLSGTYAGISNRSIAKLCKALGCELTIQQRPTPAAQSGRRPQPAPAARVPTRASSDVPARVVESGRRAIPQWERDHGQLTPAERSEGLARARALLARTSSGKRSRRSAQRPLGARRASRSSSA